MRIRCGCCRPRRKRCRRTTSIGSLSEVRTSALTLHLFPPGEEPAPEALLIGGGAQRRMRVGVGSSSKNSVRPEPFDYLRTGYGAQRRGRTATRNASTSLACASYAQRERILWGWVARSARTLTLPRSRWERGSRSRHFDFPSPIGRRWRAAPDEGRGWIEVNSGRCLDRLNVEAGFVRPSNDYCSAQVQSQRFARTLLRWERG